MSDGGPVVNTGREIWRERPGDAYADSIHVTKQGNIGINCGGTVIVMSVRAWFASAEMRLKMFDNPFAPKAPGTMKTEP